MGLGDFISSSVSSATGSTLINNSARDTQAALYRQQFDDYVRRFGPAEQELVAAYGDKGLRDAGIAEAKNYATQGLANAKRAQEVTQSRYQAPQTAQEKAAQERQYALAGGLSRVDMANRTRQHYLDRDLSMLTGGLSGFAKREVS